MGKLKSLIVHIVFSHVGLCIIVFAYAIGGAYLFIAIEGPNERDLVEKRTQVANDIETYRTVLIAKVLSEAGPQATAIGVNFNPPDDPWATFQDYLDGYHATVSDAISQYSYSGEVPLDEDEYPWKWGFESVFLFTMTILTTIGYGHIAPKTSMGQIMVIFYALIAIPLMTMFLSNVSSALMHGLTLAYEKGCCRFLFKKRDKSLCASKATRPQPQRNPDEVPLNTLPDAGRNSALEAEEMRLENASPTPSIADRLEPFHLEEYNPEDGELPSENGAAGAPNETTPAEEEEPVDDPVPATLSLFIIVFYLVCGTVLYKETEGWSLVNSGYFCLVSLLTIGFGDYYPGVGKTGAKAKITMGVSTIYILLGLVILAVGMALITNAIKAHFKKVGQLMEQHTGLDVVDDDDADNKPKKKKPTEKTEDVTSPAASAKRSRTAVTTADINTAI